MGAIREVKILRDFKEYGTLRFVPFSLGINFSSSATNFPSPVHSDADVALASNKLLSIHDGRQILTGKTVTASEKVQLKIAVTMVDKNADYAEPIANKLASQGGDEQIAISLITGLGFLWYIKEGHKRGDGFINEGDGWAQAHEGNIVDTPEIHYFEYGIPDAMNTPPTDKNIVSLPVGDVIFSGLKSGEMIAYRHACTTTVSGKSGTSPISSVNSSLGKVITPIPINKSKHPVIDVHNPIQLIFGPWRYLRKR